MSKKIRVTIEKGLLCLVTLIPLGIISNALASGDRPSPTEQWYESGKDAVVRRLAVKNITSHAKNVILFIGDGMGISTITAGRIYDGQSRGESGEESSLSFEQLPHVALIKTYNTNQQVPDSAGTATAMNTGVKTRAGVIGIGPEAHRASCAESATHHLRSLAEIAEEHGMRTGIVTTTRLTHATPAAVYAHSPERDWEADSDIPEEARAEGCHDIARQFVDFSAGDGIDVAFGGGQQDFFGATVMAGGRRLDPRDDLVAAWLKAAPHRHYVNTRGKLNAVLSGQVLGLFSDSHMTFMKKRHQDSTEPTLSEMTEKAIDLLKNSPKGFYLMVEGGKIDLGHHEGIAELALSETQEFAHAIEVALSKVDLNKTLILVTADHSHVFTLAGYPTRGNPILGLAYGNDQHGDPTGVPVIAADGKAYTTLGYYNGPGAVQEARPAPDTGPLSHQQSLVPTGDYFGHGSGLSETHSGEDVALFAAGPWSHLVGGVLEQHAIFHIITYAYGWDLSGEQ